MIFFRKLHKWIGLAIGIQVAIWMVSGFMMGLLDHEQVTGHHNQTGKHASASLLQGRELVEPAEILSQLSDGAVIRRLHTHRASLPFQLVRRAQARRFRESWPMLAADPESVDLGRARS